jgi:hypothetical protein
MMIFNAQPGRPVIAPSPQPSRLTTRPFPILHGDRDMPLEQSQTVRRIEIRRPVDLVVVKNAGHGRPLTGTPAHMRAGPAGGGFLR